MNFQDLVFDDNGPVYLQVIRYFKKKMLIGELKHGDELPSRRILSAALGLNLTTIQKIYKQLEEEGFIDTLPNSKTTVVISSQQLEQIEKELVGERIKKFIDELKSCEVEKDRALDLIDEMWD